VQYEDADAEAGQNEPAGQMLLTLAAKTVPGGQKNPATQGPDTVDKALNKQYEPALHTLGAESPVDGQ
jgi:uncharacterized protein YecT (DUF1311 family)